MNLQKRIILALDVKNLKKAKYFLDKLFPKIKIYKVGPVLFTACGPKIIELIHRKGGEVFLDLKYHDIPNTVAHAVAQAVRLKVKMLTLHICGKEEMLRQAVKAAKSEAAKLKVKAPLLIGVTVLTSQKTSLKKVLSLANLGLGCGLDGIVCSAQEVNYLKKKINKKFIAVTPGIRPNGAQVGDQKRVATACVALKAGSDFLVVGRPILEAKDPLAAVENLI